MLDHRVASQFQSDQNQRFRAGKVRKGIDQRHGQRFVEDYINTEDEVELLVL
jgi:hypothetical protein